MKLRLATLAFVGLVATPAAAGEIEEMADAAAAAAPYRRADRPTRVGPGDLCYPELVQAFSDCEREWPAGAREEGGVGCLAFAGVRYDHCRWGGFCHHGEE